MADYGGQDTAYKSLRAKQIDNLKRYEPKAAPTKPGEAQLYTISIDDAIRHVVASAKQDPSNLVPAIGPAVTPSIQPIYGRPKPLAAGASAGDAAGAAGGTVPAGTPGSENLGPADEGFENLAPSSAPMSPTGGQGPGGGPPPAATPTQPGPAPVQPKQG